MGNIKIMGIFCCHMYTITWKWDEFSKALHMPEVAGLEISNPYRIYVVFTDKKAVDIARNSKGDVKGIPSREGIENVLYVGKINHSRSLEKDPEYPMRIGERIFNQGHSPLFTLFEYEPGPIYLAAGAINEPYFRNDDDIGNIEGFLINRFGPRYNQKREGTTIVAENTTIKSAIHSEIQRTMFTKFLEFTL